MANSNPNRPGQINGEGAADAMFEKVHAGEILTAFETKQQFKDKQQVRSISHGKSASFPATWKITSGYHQPGTEILGEQVDQNEVVVTIDGKLMTSVFIDDLDDAMNHWDQDSVYTMEMGRELAKQYDANVARQIVLASRASGIVAGAPGGGFVESATIADTSEELAKAIYAAIQSMAEDDVPLDDTIFAAFRPSEYFMLAQDTKLMNKDWGGQGSYSTAQLPLIAGANILMSNNTSFGLDLSADSKIHQKYRADYSLTRGIVWHPKAVGTVQLRGLKMSKHDDGRRDGWLYKAKMAVGHGTLMPQCARELRVTAGV